MAGLEIGYVEYTCSCRTHALCLSLSSLFSLLSLSLSKRAESRISRPPSSK